MSPGWTAKVRTTCLRVSVIGPSLRDLLFEQPRPAGASSVATLHSGHERHLVRAFSSQVILPRGQFVREGFRRGVFRKAVRGRECVGRRLLEANFGES